MNQRPTIREQMDACRPDSDDLHLPEHAADLAELQAGLRESVDVRTQWERSQQDSRIIRGAMQDVSLPSGLEGRLLAAAHAAQAVPLAGVEQAVREETPAGDHPVVSTPAKTNRRLVIRVTVGLIAASVLVGVFAVQSWPQKEQQVSKDQLASQVDEWLRTVDVRTMVKPTKAMRPPGGVLGTVVGSSSIASSQGKVTAYSVSLRGSNATLLVIPTSQQYPVNSMPFTKVSGISGGWLVGAWQKDGVLYVIAVLERSGADLNQFTPLRPIG
ncbi:MAG: hypothetical protein IAF94_12015 [Pirellulaceae bacterium]|nr:hypothetical protein [Pirellulaceae bacterium]